MDLKISVNFDFGKLANNIGDIMDEYTRGYAKESERASKDNIDKGLSPPLHTVTRLIRFKRKQPLRPPLKASGKLYKSIRQEKSSLKKLNYGLEHHKGFTTDPKSKIPNKDVEPRPFIDTIAKNKKELDKKFMESTNKALASKVRTG